MVKDVTNFQKRYLGGWSMLVCVCEGFRIGF